MPAEHFLGDRIDHIGKLKGALLLGHAGVIDHLQQQVAELILQSGHVLPFNGINNLVGLFDGIGGNGRKGLREVPGTTRVWGAQGRHNGEQVGQRFVGLRRHGTSIAMSQRLLGVAGAGSGDG